MPRLILRHFAEEGELLTVSPELAHRLHDVQTGSMSSGLLVVAAANHGDEPVLVVLKLEKEEGVRASQARVEDKTTLTVEYMRELS